jgi:membrane protease YdiL (CAAX protease family)
MASIFILAVPIIYLSLRYGVIKITDFRLRGPDLVVLLISFVILVIVVSIISLEGPYKPYSLYGQKISELQRSERFIALLSIFFALPFLEETLFRRYIFEIFRGGYNFPLALLITALLDTGVHASEESLTGLVSIFFWEVFFTMIYFKSRLGVSIIMHCLTNFSLYHL